MQDGKRRLDGVERDVAAHGRLFDRVKPIITVLGKAASSWGSPSDLLKCVSALEQGRGNGSSTFPASAPPPTVPPATGNSVLTQISDKVDILWKQTSGGQYNVGQLLFPSFAELKNFVKNHFSCLRFGLVVDAHSFPEFFFTSAQTVNKVMTTIHGSVKAGFQTMFETRVAAAAQNVLPTIFSKATGPDMGVHLPAVLSLDKWDSGDGTQGLFYRIMEEIPNVQEQFESAISLTLAGAPSATALCTSFLVLTCRFWSGLCTFINNLASRLMVTGNYSKAETWNLISQFVKRIFFDIAAAKATARDIRDHSNSLHTCSQYIWASIKAYKVMETFLSRNFYDHPSVASVLTTYMVVTMSKEKISMQRVKDIEKSVEKINCRLDTITTSIETLEKDLKKVKEKK